LDKCQECGTVLTEGAVYCDNCGAVPTKPNVVAENMRKDLIAEIDALKREAAETNTRIKATLQSFETQKQKIGKEIEELATQRNKLESEIVTLEKKKVDATVEEIQHDKAARKMKREEKKPETDNSHKDTSDVTESHWSWNGILSKYICVKEKCEFDADMKEKIEAHWQEVHEHEKDNSPS